jgi:PEP-CTERM motif
MRKALFTFTLLASAFTLPLTAHADTIDDFVITGGGNRITFSLPASPPGNLSTCPTGIITSCLPGSETDFTVSTLVTFDNVSALESIDFPTGRFGGGLSLPQIRLFGNGQLFTPDAATPTFLIGDFSLSAINPSGNPPIITYDLTITPETSTAPTPEPASLTLLATGAGGILSLAARRRKARKVLN